MKNIEQESPAAWCARVPAGTVLVYHRGDLAHLSGRNAARRRAGEWMALADRGLVALTQRRLGPGDYEYRATRTSTPATERQQLKDAVVSGRHIVTAMLGTT